MPADRTLARRRGIVRRAAVTNRSLPSIPSIPSVASLVAVIAIGVSAGCAGSDAREIGASEQAVQPIRSTVGILAEGCRPSASSGSGVAIGRPGQVVTVAHTVAGASSLTMVDSDGNVAPARVLAFDPEADLAVLAVVDDGTEFDAPPLDLADAAADAGPATMTRWTTSGGVEEFDIVVRTRLAITIDDIYETRRVERSGIEVGAAVDVGDSGAPVLSADGEVLGIVYARSKSRADTAFASDADEVRAVLSTVTGTEVDNGRCV